MYPQPIGERGWHPQATGEGQRPSVCWGHEVLGLTGLESPCRSGEVGRNLLGSLGILAYRHPLKAHDHGHLESVVELFQEMEVCQEPGVWVCLALHSALDSHGTALQCTMPDPP